MVSISWDVRLRGLNSPGNLGNEKKSSRRDETLHISEVQRLEQRTKSLPPPLMWALTPICAKLRSYSVFHLFLL